MFSCPTNDIHSVYIDGELPQNYIVEYENHIKTCPKCAATVASMRAISATLHADNEKINNCANDIFVSQSYERLMNRMSYSRVSKKANRFSNMTMKAPYFIPLAVAAAAAVLIAVFLPIRNATSATNFSQVANVAPIKKAQQVSMQKKNIIINGTISPSSISTAMPLNVSNNINTGISLNDSFFDIVQQPNVENTSNIFTDFDIFVPQIEQKQLVLKLTPMTSLAGQRVWTLTLDSDE